MADSVVHKEEGSMPKTENKDEPTLLSKRKLDSLPVSDGKEEEEVVAVVEEEEEVVAVVEEEDQPNKIQKLQSLVDNGNSPVIEEETTETKPLQRSSKNSGANSSISEVKNGSKAVAEDKDAGEGGEEDDDDVDYEDEDEEENGEAAVVDTKGKGIMVEDEEGEDSDDDDDDDSSDGGSELDGDGSELEDDPLTEVDLDNILPSRTRRRTVLRGVSIANSRGNWGDD